MAITTIDNICKGFPHKDLLPLTTAEPDYQYIKKVHDLLKANAASVRSGLGGGAHGLLGLVMRPQLYFQLAGVPFVAPADPGNGPDLVNGNLNGPEVT